MAEPEQLVVESKEVNCSTDCKHSPVLVGRVEGCAELCSK